ncbi:PadR family transcriptional regulator [Novosphingobium sp. B 225]|uniref:PadR family transcriptional regulator n=1 Tax=Novosphingobium sp. B 225 TaxID=1961849 RepID=UPI000B4AC1A5|nr:PadR family transcriptional regulator [Novosphingobium sp. B 225]
MANRLTDLEGAALAEIAKRGAATSYAVAQAFAGSPSEFWSGSAGAVYPMIKRMAARGLLNSETALTGKRPSQTYCLTEQGVTALHGWLLDCERAAGLGFDPLRTRLVHLHLVPVAQREQFLAGVRSQFAQRTAKDAFESQPLSRKVHQTWLRARAQWLGMLDQLIE